MPKRLPGPDKIHVPDEYFPTHRRATSQHGAPLDKVPFGVQFVQRFTNGEKDPTEPTRTVSTRDKAERTSRANNMQPSKAIQGQDVRPKDKPDKP